MRCARETRDLVLRAGLGITARSIFRLVNPLQELGAMMHAGMG